LEQALGRDGIELAESNQSLSDLDRAIDLVGLALKGGESEHGLITEPLKAPELRAQAELIKSLLLKFKMLALVRLKNPEKAGIGSVFDQQFDMVFKEILNKASNLEDMVEAYRERNEVESTRLFLVIISTWTVFLLTTAAGLLGREKRRRSAEAALLKANETLLSQAEELTEHREHLVEQVERRTAELTAANLLLRDEIAVRRLAEGALKETHRQIRDLSSQLLRAQEIERRQISMELHDELGQALNAMKFQVRFIEKRLDADQGEIRKDCEDLMEYADQVIENVRRLSLALSPTILGDLGLTSAIQWLINSFSRNSDTHITSDIANIDHLFSESHEIVIYRVIQEALTNIASHAQAANVSVMVRSDDDKVTVSVADDGKGFDPKQATMKDTPDNGLGLGTMNDRVTMVGGVLDVQSEHGKGTRISFSVPIEKEVA
jgi:signal transduction histidine kinase